MTPLSMRGVSRRTLQRPHAKTRQRSSRQISGGRRVDAHALWNVGGRAYAYSCISKKHMRCCWTLSLQPQRYHSSQLEVGSHPMDERPFMALRMLKCAGPFNEVRVAPWHADTWCVGLASPGYCFGHTFVVPHCRLQIRIERRSVYR